MRKLAVILILCALAVASLAARDAAAQCALCAESVAASQDAGGGDIALAFNAGILFLLGFVLFLFAGLIGFIVYVARASTRAAVECPPDGSH